MMHFCISLVFKSVFACRELNLLALALGGQQLILEAF